MTGYTSNLNQKMASSGNVNNSGHRNDGSMTKNR